MSIFLLPKKIHNKENIQMKEDPDPLVQEVPCKLVNSCNSVNSKYPNKKFCNGCIQTAKQQKNMMLCCKSRNIKYKDKCYQWTMQDQKPDCVSNPKSPYNDAGMEGITQPIHPENPNQYGCYEGKCTKVSPKGHGQPLEECEKTCRSE